MQRAARLAVFGWTVATAIWIVYSLPGLWFPHGLDPTPPRDFDYYYVAARIGWAHGWDRLYDLDLQGTLYAALRPDWTFTWATVFVSLPPMAWLAAPLALLPHAAAFWTWVAVTALAYFGLGAVTVPGPALARVAVLLSGIWIHPVMTELQMGQNSLPVALLMVGAALLLERRRDLVAGALIGIGVALKPQVAVLVPLALLVAGRWHVTLASAVTGTVLAVASLASLGPHGLQMLWTDLSMEQGHLDNMIWSPAILVGVGPLATAIQGAVVVVALAAAVAAGRGSAAHGERRVDLVVAAGLLGSLGAFSYHHESDWSALVAVAWLWARGERGRWLVPYLIAGGALLALLGPLGIQPAVAFTFAAPAVLLVAAARRLPWQRREGPDGAPAQPPG